MDDADKKLELIEVARRAVDLAKRKGAKEAAATTNRVREVDVTWRDGRVERVSESTTRNLSIELYVEGRYSSVRTSDLRADAIEAFIAESIGATKTLAPDEHRGLPEPELYRDRSSANLEIEDPKQAALTPEDRKAWAKAMEEAARAIDKKGAIISVTTGFSDGVREYSRVASNGFEGTMRGTQFNPYATVSVKDADGRRPDEYDAAVARFMTDLPEPSRIGLRAAERAISRLGTTKGKSRVRPMAVDNRAAGRLVVMMLNPMTGGAIQQKRSFLDEKLGQVIGSKLLHISDEPLLKRGLASRAFDFEGITARTWPMFQDGKLETLYVDTYYGRKLATKPTTAGASNLIWRLGTNDQSALLHEMKDGVLVTGFLGGNSNDATGDFSLGIRGFEVRGGEIAEPLGEMNVSGNQLTFWKRLVHVGNDPYRYNNGRTPTLVFDAVDLAGV